MMMQSYEKIENRLKDFHAKLPHLPVAVRRWVANNIWWIVLIGAVLGVFVTILLLLLTMFSGMFLFLVGAVAPSSAISGSMVLLVAMVIIVLTIANVVVAVMAVRPLKYKIRTGWLLLAASLLLGLVASLLTDIIGKDNNAWAVVNELILITFGLYVMFEIREYFTSSPVGHMPPDTSPVSKFGIAKK